MSKELNETMIWLGVIAQSVLVPGETTAPIVAENQELSHYRGINQDRTCEHAMTLDIG